MQREAPREIKPICHVRDIQDQRAPLAHAIYSKGRLRQTRWLYPPYKRRVLDNLQARALDEQPG